MPGFREPFTVVPEALIPPESALAIHVPMSFFRFLSVWGRIRPVSFMVEEGRLREGLFHRGLIVNLFQGLFDSGNLFSLCSLFKCLAPYSSFGILDTVLVYLS